MNFRKILVICIVLTLLSGVIFVALKNPRKTNSTRLQVTTSFYPMYFFTKQIGGIKADVFNITPASSEPHDYEPTAQQIARIEDSQLLVLNGGSLESWGTKIQDELQNRPTVIATAGQGIVNKMLVEERKTVPDPHIWLNPILAKKEVQAIELAYEKANPSNKTYYRNNAYQLEQKLDLLDKEYQEGLQSCELNTFVTSHAAFAYLAQQYHINQVSISGISPDEEPSSQVLADISDMIKREKIPVVFFESLVSPKLSDTIAKETGATTLVLDPLEGIPKDELDKGADYFSVMRQNLTNLEVALICKK